MEEIDIKEMLVVLLKKKVFIIAITLIFAILTFSVCSISNFILGKKQEKNPLYYAETSFIIGTSETMNAQVKQDFTEDSASINISEQGRIVQTDLLFDTYFELLKSKTSLNRVIDVLNLDLSANELESLINVSQDSQSALLSLTVAYKDKEKVTQIADKLVSEFISNMEKAYSTDKVAIIDKAYLLEGGDLAKSSAVRTITPFNFYNVQKYTLISAFIGLIISVALVLLKELLDDTIKNENSLEKLSNSKNIVHVNKKSENSENQFALLKLKLTTTKTILVSSPEKNDDLSYVSHNLANVFAKSKNKVLLLDLNPKDYMTIKKYDFKTLLASIHKDNKKISKLTQKSATELFEILYINQNLDNYLDEKGLKDFILALESAYDTIIINSEDILNNACTFATSKVVKNILIVINERKTKINDFNKINENIENVKKIILVK